MGGGYTDVPFTLPMSGHICITIKDNKAASTNINASELAKIFQITWVNPKDPTNKAASDAEAYDGK